MAYIPSREFFETNPRFKGLTLEEAQERYGMYLKDKCMRNPHLTLEAAQEQLMKEFKHDFKLHGSATGRLSSPRIEPHVIRPSELRDRPDVQTLIDKAIHDLANRSAMEAHRIMVEGNWDVSPFENKHTGPSAGVDCSQPFTQAMLEQAIREMREAGVSREIPQNRKVNETAKQNAIHYFQCRLGLTESDIASEPESPYPDGHDDPMAAIRDMCK